MLREVVERVLTSPDGVYVDGTLGTGGHSEALCRKMSSRGLLIGLDRDEEAIRICRQRLSPFGKRVRLFEESFSRLDRVLGSMGIEKVHGLFLDLGMSSYQLENSGRGFSFNRDEPLDMRMDLEDEPRASDLVNRLSAKELEQMLRSYGEEKQAKAIARAIERERRKAPIESSLRLANLVASVVRRSYRPGAKHPATRTFQALRIAVNRELDALRTFLDKVPLLLVQGGRAVVLSYHSLEDRMVKEAMIEWEGGCRCPPRLPRCGCGSAPLLRRVHKKGIKPTPEEKESNPRARSAVLRTAERI